LNIWALDANIILLVQNIRGQAITKYGFFKGSYLGIKRILRCNPFSKGGYDPVR